MIRCGSARAPPVFFPQSGQKGGINSEVDYITLLYVT
jgi:hypothetical protein